MDMEFVEYIVILMKMPQNEYLCKLKQYKLGKAHLTVLFVYI